MHELHSLYPTLSQPGSPGGFPEPAAFCTIGFLYDLEKDPWETVNPADAPASAEVRQEMGELLKAGWQAALPPRATTKV